MKMTQQRNLWKLFSILSIFFFIFLIVSLYLRYTEIKSKRLSQLCYAQETLWRGIGIFKNYETLIDSTKYFIDKHSLNKMDKRELEKYLENLIRSDELILGFRVSDQNGRKLFTNSSLEPKSPSYNLKKNPLTKEDFLNTLKSKRMVVGRPYKLNEETWILPLRKTIHSDKKKTAWVVTLGLDLQKFLETFPHNQNKIFVSLLLKDPTFERVFRSHTKPDEFERYFGKSLTKEQLKYLFSALQQAHITLNELRSSKKAKLLEFSFVDDQNVNATIYTCIQYNSSYRLWSLVTLFKQQLFRNFLPILANYLLAFVIIIAVLFFLFKKISNLERKRFEELEHQATHDPLTNLPNRYYMNQIGEEWIKTGEPFCILFLDLDNFKNINDTMGHQTGDELLVQVARRIRESLVGNALLIRHGGDEFAIFCKFDDISKIEKLANEILQNIAKPYHIGNGEFLISGSIGISCYPDDGKTLNELLSAADIAMYQAKEMKNSFRHFTHTLIEQQKRAVEIEHALHHALENNEFYLVYQPQISRDLQLHGVETLLRWKSATLGEVSPAEFVPIAERSGMIIPIGKFIIKHALDEIDALFKDLKRTFMLSINISTKQFSEHDFITKSFNQLQAIDIPPECICVEITESLLIDNLEYVLGELETIKKLGVDISMDDFGTGYSSLHMLQSLPIKELKIDKSFIDEMLENSSSSLMVKTIINLAKIMNLRTVAEGVETKEQVQRLDELGCDIYQGYFFAKPMVKEELAEFIRKEKWKDKL